MHHPLPSLGLETGSAAPQGPLLQRVPRDGRAGSRSEGRAKAAAFAGVSAL